MVKGNQCFVNKGICLKIEAEMPSLKMLLAALEPQIFFKENEISS